MTEAFGLAQWMACVVMTERLLNNFKKEREGKLSDVPKCVLGIILNCVLLQKTNCLSQQIV